MEVLDSQVEVFLVAVAVGIALQCADLVVHRFQRPGADAAGVLVKRRMRSRPRAVPQLKSSSPGMKWPKKSIAFWQTSNAVSSWVRQEIRA